jgi:AraC family transcriptional regulator
MDDYPALSFLVPGVPMLKLHSHYCYQVMCSLRGYFSCRVGDTTFSNIQSIIINKRVAQSSPVIDTPMLICIIDPTSRLGAQLALLLGTNDYLLPEQKPDNSHISIPEDYEKADPQAIAGIVDEYLKRTCYVANFKQKLRDERISSALKIIDFTLRFEISLDEVARCIFLSPDRFRHLFKEETGMAFSHYVIWERIKKVMELTRLNINPIYKNCNAYRFSDQAQFNHLFIKMFGINPGYILKRYRVGHFSDKKK